ncbi:MAG: hypothetical protein E7261_12075 [Lachnospiraceae bacterium]|nr:hypothetical protein [Lachnospiraceae bacterium]
MRQYEGKDTVTLKSIYCNKCGRMLKSDNGIITEGICSVNQLWGYFSMKDGQRHSFDLCEECYDSFVKGFVIPVENIEEKEMI